VALRVIIVMGYLQLAPGGAAVMGSALTAMVESTRAEPGCVHYALASDVTDPDLLQVSERWRDQAALGAHMVSEHLVAFQLAMRRTRILKADVNIYHRDGRIERLINT
jgi:quinol monooxygenase YgiN